MQYLKMAQAVREHIGLQGTGPSSIDAIGTEGQMLHMVRDAWADLQNYRKNWKWMRDTKSFATVSGTTTYTPTIIFGPTNRFKRWYPESFYVLDDTKKSLLRYLEYDYFVYKYRDNTNSSKVTEFTIRPQDYAVIINKPDGAYWIYADYYKNNQELSLSTTEPEMPVDYHNYIVYEATARYALSIGLSHTYQQYALKASEALGNILRELNPKEFFKVRGIV